MTFFNFSLMVVIGFVYIFICDYAVHGVLLITEYARTPALWRDAEQAEGLYLYYLLLQLLIVATAAFIFTRHYENKGIMEGVRFGFYMGILVGLHSAIRYFIMPIDWTLAAYWFVMFIVKFIGLGIIFSFICKPKA